MNTDYSELDKLIDSIGLKYTATFVPWSESRSAKADPKLADYNINWSVRLARLSPVDGQEFRGALTTDYSQGYGHLPNHLQPKTFGRVSLDEFSAVKRACESGRAFTGGPKLQQPMLRDVLHSLVSESDVLNYSTFEDWASEFGYDPDSRKGEQVYKFCLEIALKLRNLLGEENLSKLRDAYQGY